MADEAAENATEDVASQTVADQSTVDDTDPGEQSLGDAGKQALDRMKAKWKEAERLARERESALAELQAKVDGREREFAAEEERRKVESEALAKANDRILKAEVRAQAAGLLADPADALHYLDLSEFEVGADGEVDSAAIKRAIESLIKSKPYLAAQGGQVVFTSPTSQREGPVGAKQLTRDDLKGMSPEAINAARAEGRLDDLLGIKR